MFKLLNRLLHCYWGRHVYRYRWLKDRRLEFHYMDDEGNKLPFPSVGWADTYSRYCMNCNHKVYDDKPFDIISLEE
jgi:hypothetical protein